MAKGDGGMPVSQDQFEEAVLAVVDAVLRTEQRIDLAADGTLATGPLRSEGAEFRADLILCAAECLRLTTTLPGGRRWVAREFPAFIVACRAVSGADEPGATRVERARRRFAAGLRAFGRR